jgi:predicted branched-subunit amino acid permease
MGVLLGDVGARRVPVSAFCRYHVSLQRKKRCQQIIGLNDESFSIAVCIDAKENTVLGKMLGDAVRTALGMPHNNSAL